MGCFTVYSERRPVTPWAALFTKESIWRQKKKKKKKNRIMMAIWYCKTLDRRMTTQTRRRSRSHASQEKPCQSGERRSRRSQEVSGGGSKLPRTPWTDVGLARRRESHHPPVQKTFYLFSRWANSINQGRQAQRRQPRLTTVHIGNKDKTPTWPSSSNAGNPQYHSSSRQHSDPLTLCGVAFSFSFLGDARH